MRSGAKAFKKVERLEKRQVKRIKDEDFYKTVEEVFDRATLDALYQLLNRRVINVMGGAVASGKESKVYLAYDPSGKALAVKIYLTSSREFRRGIWAYIAGDPRFQDVKRGTRPLIYAWALKEFKNLELAYGAGVPVPRPVAVNKNVLVMSFIGVDGVPAPLMKEAPPPDPRSAFAKLIEGVRLLYQKAELVHSDLSEYNVMMLNGDPYIFDFGQAVLKTHPQAEELLARDVRNLKAFFSKLGLKTPSLEDLVDWVRSGTRLSDLADRLIASDGYNGAEGV